MTNQNKPSAAKPREQSEHRQRHWILWGLIALVAVVGLWLLWKVVFKPKPKPPTPPVPVVIASAQARDVPVYLTGLGSVKAYNTVTVHTQISGTLQEIAFVEGQLVKKGQLLAQIDPRPLQAQLEQAIATKAKDEALLANARQDLQRYQQLAAEDSIAIQQRDTQVALVRQDAAIVLNDQAQIDYAKVQLSYTAIKSPIDGITGIRNVDAGNLVQPGDPSGIVVVTQIQPISVIFTLPEDDFERVNEQMAKGTLPVAAASRGGGKILGYGTVLLINNEIDTSTGTVELKATFPNNNHELWPGQFVDSRLLIETRHDAVTVPAEAVQRGPKGLYAYVIDAGGKAQMKAITVSTDNLGGPIALIQSGLSAGEHVVIDGQLKLHAGSKVKVVPAQGAAPDTGSSPASSSAAASAP